MKAQFLQNMPLEANIAKEVRVYGCADEVVSSWRAAYSARLDMLLGTYRATERTALITGTSFYLFLAAVVAYLRTALITGTSFYLFLAAVVAYLLWEVSAGGVDPAVLLTVLTLCTNLFASMSVLMRDLILLDENLFAVEQQRDLLFDHAHEGVSRHVAARSSDAAKSRSGDLVFSMRDLTFSYDGVHRTLRGVDLDIREGEVVALVGENGSGKTTLVKVLMGVFKPDGGVLLFRGAPISSYTPDELSASIGAFFQDFYLFHHTLAENVAYGDVASMGDEDAVRRALSLGGAEGVVSRMPAGLSTMLGRRIDRDGVELSGGQKQLVAASRAYMGDKDVLVFDEPASMLDPLAEIEQFRTIRERVAGKTGILISHRVGFARLADRIVMMEAGRVAEQGLAEIEQFRTIRERVAGKTGILISHRVGFARLADRIVMMEAGRVAEQGTHDELMAKDGLYARFFREQARWYEGGDAT